jgi:hypothetical protein
MSKRVRYDLEMLRGFLRGFCEKEGIKLIGEYLEGKVNTKTRIRGKCLGENCEEEFEKGFRDLVTKTGGYCKTCTKKRAKDKRKQTNLRVRGVEHPSQAEEIKEKMKQTNLRVRGVKNPSQAEEIKEKKKQTNLRVRGVEHPSQAEKIKEKKKQTNLRVRGVEHPSQAEDVKEKMKQTNLERYGVEYSLQAKEVREKGKQTNLERYGVEYSAQNPLISEKTSKNAYKGYNVELPSGNTLHLQGYEIYCLQDLLNEGYEEEDIITSRKDVPEIWYTYRGKRHRYFTDFYIPKDNLLVECKSTHTMEVRFDKNLAKLEAVKALGYKMEIRVYSEKGEVVDRWD